MVSHFLFVGGVYCDYVPFADFLSFVARKQDLDDTVAIHPTSGEGTLLSCKVRRKDFLLIMFSKIP